jgi:hypothetical protein
MVTEVYMFHCGLIWGACAIGLIALLKHRRFGRHCGEGGGYGYGGPWGGHGGWHGHDGPDGFGVPRPGGFRGFGFRGMMRGLFERLDTTPGQEKAIMKAIADLREAMGAARTEMKGSRQDFAEAFRRGPIDEAAMADIFVRHDTVISDTRRKAVEAVGRIHEALDDNQRAQVADLLEHGLGFSRGGGWRGRGGYGYRW